MTEPAFTTAAATLPPTQNGAIHVPQACFGIARGPVGPIEYVKTRVAQCVGISLSATLKDQEFPVVLMAHMDDGNSGEDQTEMLLEYMTQLTASGKVTSLKAYIVNGDDNPELYEPVIRMLKEAGYECAVTIMDSQVPTLVISLRTGEPPETAPDSGFISYEPEPSCDQAFNWFVFSDRTRHPLDTELRTEMMAMAFNLLAGMPPYYMAKSAPIGPAPAPSHP